LSARDIVSGCGGAGVLPSGMRPHGIIVGARCASSARIQSSRGYKHGCQSFLGPAGRRLPGADDPQREPPCCVLFRSGPVPAGARPGVVPELDIHLPFERCGRAAQLCYARGRRPVDPRGAR
jgi:hypothetical protein